MVLTAWHSLQPSQFCQLHFADHGLLFLAHHDLQVPSNLVVLELGSSVVLLDDSLNDVVETSCCVVVLVTSVVVVLSSAVVLASAIVVRVVPLVLNAAVLVVSAAVVLVDSTFVVVNVSGVAVVTGAVDVEMSWLHSGQPEQPLHVHRADQGLPSDAHQN